MTVKEAGEVATTPEETEIPTEALPHADLDRLAPEARHLALGASPVTFCGLPKAGLAAAHPSKARRTDCPECRDAYRRIWREASVGGGCVHKAGERVEFPDGSAWLVEDVRAGAMDVRCLVGTPANPKGKRTTVSPDSPLRTFADAEFEALVAAALEARKPVPEAAAPAAPTAGKPRGATWKPTKADVDEVRRLRALGRSYMAIEAEMGWPDGHGNRPFRIVKGAWKYEDLA
jgi:hypothetical protein